MYLPELNKLAETIGFVREKTGFEEPIENPERKMLLAISEICEAQNELRDGYAVNEIYYNENKPEGFPVEIADAIIRLLDLAHSCKIDIAHVIAIKIEYNKTRPAKHGRKF